MKLRWILLALLLVLAGCPEPPPPADDDDDVTDDDDITGDDDDAIGDDDDSAIGEDDDDDDSSVGDDDDSADDDDDSAEPLQELDCPGTSLTCATVGGSTIGEPDNVNDWNSCDADGGHWTGGEDVFRFVPGGDGEVTFTLTWSDAGQDLDLFVVSECGAVDGCLGTSLGSTTSESVTVPAVAAVPLFIVIDGKDGAGSAYQLTADCDSIEVVEVGTSVVDVAYCLDWNTVNVIEPPGLISLLSTFGGIDITDFPLLINPTAVDPAANEIEILGSAAIEATCTQDPIALTIDITASQPGLFVDPYFEAGPSNLVLPAPGLTVYLYDSTITGLFSEDASQITDSTVNGALGVPPNVSTACSFLACYPCPSGIGDCVDFSADSAVWDDNGFGPLTPNP